MIGTLTLRFPPTSTVSFSHRKTLFPSRNLSKSTIHAAVAEAAVPAVDTRKPHPTSLYEVLRVRRNATATEIKTAYRILAKQYHPDASRSLESDGRDFIEIHKAYETLSDPTARAVYDLTLLSVGCLGGGEGFGFGYYSYGSSTGYYSTRRWETDQCW